MKIRLDAGRIALQARQLLRIEHARGVRIDCMRGTLWLTQQADARDVILEAGGTFVFDRRGMALVSALEPASVRLEARRRKAPPRRADSLQYSLALAFSAIQPRW